MAAVPAAIPANESERLEALRRYGLLDTPAEQAFEDITQLASFVCGTPMSVLTLVDADRQWFKSRIGIDDPETHRDLSFCAHAILQDGVFVVPDAMKDIRFRGNPYVTDDPNIRFYAGSPIVTEEGLPIGTICVIDRVPRELSAAQLAALEALSRQAMAQIELRRRYSEIQDAYEKLEALDHMKSQFVSMVSHELRTPLTSIRGGLQLVLQTIDAKSHEDEHALLNAALHSSERLIRLTNDILDMSKFEAGKMELHRIRTRFEPLVELAINAVGHLPGRAVPIEREIATDLPDITVDPDRIVQALVNFLSNAIKFSPPGASVKISARAERGGVTCTITDRGAGMTVEERDRLFQPFVQLAGGVKAGGTGLGLVITRQIIDQHGGTLTVESTPGQGSSFSFWVR
jgi:signal transduction histidine kinase